jgi:hypothetical protein
LQQHFFVCFSACFSGVNFLFVESFVNFLKVDIIATSYNSLFMKFKDQAPGTRAFRLYGMDLYLKKSDIIEPKKQYSIKELLEEAGRIAKMGVMEED